jgi:tRNA(Ile2) C34 agmatinyltransferase TiaS
MTPPTCRDCGTNVLVDGQRGRGADWRCYGCGASFETPATHAAQRGRGGRRR